MNEELINKFVKYKINIAGKLVEHLPTKASAELKDLGRLIIESVNESVLEMKEQPTKKSTPSDKLNNVPIE